MLSDNIATVMLSVLATLLALTPVGYVAYRNLPAHVATVDVKQLVDEEQKRTMELLGHRVDENERAALKQLTIEFATRLSTIVDALGTECRCVIVNKAALLGGAAVDYTEIVRERVTRGQP